MATKKTPAGPEAQAAQLHTPMKTAGQRRFAALRSLPEGWIKSLGKRALNRKRPIELYVPCSQPLMYFFCSVVRMSIWMPIDSSLWRAMKSSTSLGTV